jgi:predicted NUDIX family phosphoesterase
VSDWRREEVLVVARTDIFPDGAWHGFVESDLDRRLEVVARRHTFKPRGEVEDDPEWQQVIPYVVFSHGDRYLLTRRLKQGSEKRLRHLYSLGVGGHINREDVVADADLLVQGLTREFNEEVVYDGAWSHRLMGLINDDSNAVSQVHLAVVYEVRGDRPEIAIRETGKLEGELLRLDEMKMYYLDMESWSQLIYDHLLARDRRDGVGAGAEPDGAPA